MNMPTLRPYQKECVDIINHLDSGSALVVMATGLGKCLAPGTKVLMMDGYGKKVEDICSGDVVMGPDSQGRIVAGLAHGREEMFRISSEQMDYTVNKSHILSLIVDAENPISDNKGNVYQYGDIVHISVADYLEQDFIFKKGTKGYKVGIDFKEKTLKNKTNPYDAGFFLLSEENNKKYIPNIYKVNSKYTRMSYLAGILDFCGEVYEDHYRIEINHRYLKEDILFLARSLGFYVSYSKNHIDIRGHISEIPVKNDFSVIDENHLLYFPIRVKSVGEGEYYGFSLLGNDRRFVLYDFTVTHNTVCFSNIERNGKTLILSHREELVHQPEKYYDCPFGIERANESSHGEEVVSASVQTLIHRLDKFSPDEFDTIITDEAHHAVAPSYQKIYEYFHPRRHLGFTATPSRGDKIGLNKVYDKIIYQRNIQWGIENHYLSNVECRRVNLGYNINDVKKYMGDFSESDLDKAINLGEFNEMIADIYKSMAKGPTVIFAVSVEHTLNITNAINNLCGKDEARAIVGMTENRSEILKDFKNGKIRCLVNCMVLTEGTDLPMIQTIIMARPTSNESLYAQAVGRGLRLYPGKESLLLIDCVGVSENLHLCTAPSLLGLDDSVIQTEKRKQLEGDLLSMKEKIENLTVDPTSWILQATAINLFAEEVRIDKRNLNLMLQADSSLICPIGSSGYIYISPVNDIGICSAYHKHPACTVTICENVVPQDAIDKVYIYLKTNYRKDATIWDYSKVSRWGSSPISEKQYNFIRWKLNSSQYKKYGLTGYDPSQLSKYQASIIINKMICEERR